jgi:hypothetical protein
VKRTAQSGALVLILAGSATCSSSYRLDETPVGAPDHDAAAALDGAARDAETRTEADGAPTLVNIHPFSSFESGCAGWAPYQAELTSDDHGHSGAKSCRVCSTVTNPPDISTADDNGAIDSAGVGQRYRVEAWIRRTFDGAGGPPGGAGVVIRTFDVGPLVRKEQAGSALVPASETWTLLTADLDITQPAQKIGVYVGGASQIGTCFLLDDVRVYRLR